MTRSSKNDDPAAAVVDVAIREGKVLPANRELAEAYARRYPKRFALSIDDAGTELLGIATQLQRAAADFRRRSEQEDAPTEIMEAAAELLGFRDAVGKRPEKVAQDLKKVVRLIGARRDVKSRVRELRVASQAADRVVGKPGPHSGLSPAQCEEIRTKYERWMKSAHLRDRRQSTFAELLGMSVSTLRRRIRDCDLDLTFARSRNARK